MGLEAISVEMKLKTGAAPELMPDVFFHRVADQWLPQFFTPREVRGFVDRVPVGRDLKSGEVWNQIELWQGEKITNDSPLSRITADFSLFGDVPPGGQIELQFYGGLYHQPHLPDHQPHLPAVAQDWYGRILSFGPGASKPWLSFIATVRLDWNEFGRGIRVSFPFAGYPLTSVQPQLDDSFAFQAASVPDVVQFNREALLSVFRQLPEALGSCVADVSYKVDWKQALFPGDQEALREWEFRLGSR